jgi:hypothetical protein
VLTDVKYGTIMVNLGVQFILAMTISVRRPSFTVSATEGICGESPCRGAELNRGLCRSPGYGMLFTPPSLVSARLKAADDQFAGMACPPYDLVTVRRCPNKCR